MCLGGLNKTAEFKDEDVTVIIPTLQKLAERHRLVRMEYNVGFGVFDSNNNLKDFVKTVFFQTN
ncbi:MAG: hypothetical protein ACLR56_06760 [Oscillospiraceae bacterium]